MAVPPTLRRALGRSLGVLDKAVPGRDGITVLAYHRVGAITPISVDLPAAHVAAQLDWLVDHAEVVTLDTALERVRPGARPGDPNGRPQVVLTADDGTADWVEVLLPLLVERRLPMTWYLATAFVDEQRSFPNNGRPVTWNALAEAVSTGLICVGSHTHTHAVMSRLDAPSAAAELDRSIALVEDRLGHPCLHFAYPKALAPSPAADTEVRRRVRSAALAGNRVNVPGRTDPCRLGRTPVQRSDTVDDFTRKVTGHARLEGWLRERVDRRRHRSAMS